MRRPSLGSLWGRHSALLLPLPEAPFETGLALNPPVDRYGMVAVPVCRYSVPVRFIGRTVHVLLRSSEVVGLPRPDRDRPPPA